MGEQLEAFDGAHRQRQRVGDGLLRPALASRVSVARQMSTLVIEARIRFSDIERMASALSSASQTSTSMRSSPAAMAALARRLPVMMVKSPFCSVTRGGWITPTALIDATSCSSIAGGAGVRRGLFGLGLRARGSTLRSSAMMGS